MPEIFMKKEIGDTKDVLQDIVVVVSLISTLAKSFGSAGELYRKLKKKTKKTKKGLKEDVKQEIIEHSSEHERNSEPEARSKDHHDRDHPRWRSRSRSRRARDESCDSGKESIEHSSELVRAEFERGYHCIGERYAVGDLTTRNQLQLQVITIQQRLLYIYEDIILNPDFARHSPSYHIKELVRTTRVARSASIDALAMQYQRMLPAPESRDTLYLPPRAFPDSQPTHKLHELTLRKRRTGLVENGEHHSLPPGSSSDGKTKPRLASPHLYCMYARDLQQDCSRPLCDNFKPSGDGCCPHCDAHISTRVTKAWEIIKENEQREGFERTFLVGTRFFVKCHRQGGGYACILCSQCKDVDTVCAGTRELVDHLWKEHSCAELEMDENIGEEG